MQQKIIIGFVLTLIIVIFIPVYWVTEPGRQEAARIHFQTEEVERGVKLYNSVCAVCHGLRGEGNVGPALIGTKLSDNDLAKIIARGVPGTAMLAWGKEDDGPLKEHQIKDLVTFLRNWDSVPPETTAPLSETVATDIDAGALYKTYCIACHGADRQGMANLGPALTPDSLAALSDTEIKDTILNGRLNTAMTPWKDILKSEEIAALAQLIKYNSPQ